MFDLEAALYQDQSGAVRADDNGIYTVDAIGVCHTYPGAGGWAARFACGAVLSGSLASTTRDQMDLIAVIAAIKATPEGAVISLRASSNLMVQILHGKSRRRGNPELWAEFERAHEGRCVIALDQVVEIDARARAAAEAAYERQVAGTTSQKAAA